MTFICGSAKDRGLGEHRHETVEEMRRCVGHSLAATPPAPTPRPVVPVAPIVPARVNVRAVSHASSWRDDSSTPKQWREVERLGGAAGVAEHMTKGAVSDWIDQLKKMDAHINSLVDESKSKKADEALVRLLQAIKDGYYAAKERDEAPTIFFKVSRPVKGDYKGAFKVMTQHSEKWKMAYVLWPSQRESEYRSDIKTLLLMVVANRERAADMYALELGRCQICGVKLTDERSRYYGIGPDCGPRFPHIYQAVDDRFGPWTPGKERKIYLD